MVYAEPKSAIGTSKEEDKLEERVQIAKEMKNNGIEYNLISKCTGLSIDEIEKL